MGTKLRYILGFLLIGLFPPNGFSQNGLPQTKALSPRTANYDIQLELDTATKKIHANTVLFWQNPSSDTIRELQFHLYWNAFKNTQSTFMKGWGGVPKIFEKSLKEDCEWSWVDIRNMTDEYGNDLAPGMHFIQPDDDNEEDQTVLRVPLAQAVLPNGNIRITFDWISRIPKAMVRTGYNREFYFFAQWFPKVGVYEPAGTRYATKGQWNCHQYHRSGEYYSDFGVYNLDLTVPKGFVVGASGELTQKKENEHSQTWSFRAEDVIDFTWTASPHFQLQETEWNGIKLRMLSYPEHQHFAQRHFGTLKNSLEFFTEHIGPYPYPGLTIVHPPYHGLFTGGMEYPTLITTIGLCFLPKGVRVSESLTIHEFIHQYFMQMVATHEQEEPWMDEGFTTYYEGRILDKYYGKRTSTIDWMGITAGSAEYNRAEFFASEDYKIADHTYRARDYKHGGYKEVAYNKTAIWMITLEGLLGRETFDEIMKTYFERWKFKHPCRQDYIDVVNEVVWKNHGDMFGENMDWFFQQVLYGTEECDYKVASISNATIDSKSGVFEDLEDCLTPEAEKMSALYRSRVILSRLGEMKLPVEVQICFEDGNKMMKNWDGMARSVDFIFEGSSKIESVEIDPQRKIWIDKNFINNSLTLKPSNAGWRKYLSQFMIWIQNAMHSLSFLV